MKKLRHLVFVTVVCLLAGVLSCGLLTAQENYWEHRLSDKVRAWGYLGVPEAFVVDHEIEGTELDKVYQSERWALNFSIIFEIKAGTYDIEFLECENFEGVKWPKERLFDIIVQGETAIPEVDVYGTCGVYYTAYGSVAEPLIAKGIVVEDEGGGYGLLWIEFKAINSAAMVKGVTVHDQNGQEVAFINCGLDAQPPLYEMDFDF